MAFGIPFSKMNQAHAAWNGPVHNTVPLVYGDHDVGLVREDERAEVARFIQERWATLPPTMERMQGLQAQFNRQHWARWLGQEAFRGV